MTYVHRFLGILLASGILAAVASPALAAGSHRSAAADFVEATNLKARIERLTNQIRDKQIAAVGQWYVPADTQGPAQVFVRKATALVRQELGWARLKDEFIGAYMSAYTRDELIELTKFYRSPLGQKFLAKQSELAAAGLEITERHLKNLLPKLQAISDEFNAAVERNASKPSDN